MGSSQSGKFIKYILLNLSQEPIFSGCMDPSLTLKKMDLDQVNGCSFVSLLKSNIFFPRKFL